MARSITYEGDTIQATPRETDGRKWRLHICMSGNDHLGVRTSEFTAEGLCATEQEADICGITFSQRVIDGKVEGLAVMDVKPEDRLATPRFRVQFRTTFSASLKTGRNGYPTGSVYRRMPHREPADPRTRFLLGTAYLYARHRMAAHDREDQHTMGGRAHVRAGLRAAP